jgi:nucleoid DNA-binding protein
MPTVTKRKLVMKITDELGSSETPFTQREVQTVVQAFIDAISDSLSRGDSVSLRKFGNFEVRELAAKIGRNPKAPDVEVPIPARASVKFKPGNELKEKVATTLHLIREKNRSMP